MTDARAFEDAVAAFGAACWDVQARERTLAGWLGHYLMCAFGTHRVFIEVGLGLRALSQPLPHNHWIHEKRGGFPGPHDELIPDLMIAREPGLLDLRNHKTRELGCLSLLGGLSIVAELKTTCSSRVGLRWSAIETELYHLALCLEAHATRAESSLQSLGTYLILLDNHRDRAGTLTRSFSREKMPGHLDHVQWDASTPRPVILVVTPDATGDELWLDIYRDFALDPASSRRVAIRQANDR